MSLVINSCVAVTVFRLIVHTGEKLERPHVIIPPSEQTNNANAANLPPNTTLITWLSKIVDPTVE